MSEFDLSTMSAESLLMTLAKRQEESINAEAEEARAKAKLEAIVGTVMDFLNKEDGKSLEVAKRLVWGREEVVEAHTEYLDAMVVYKTKQAAMLRAKEALGLWQTLRADARRA